MLIASRNRKELLKGGENMFYGNIENLAKENINFRKVIYTGVHSQLVLMSISIGEDIGEEMHETTDQILFFVGGNGEAVISGKSQKISAGDVVFVPQGTLHNFINTGDKDLKLYTVYSPSAHPPETIYATKEEAQKEEKY